MLQRVVKLIDICAVQKGASRLLEATVVVKKKQRTDSVVLPPFLDIDFKFSVYPLRKFAMETALATCRNIISYMYT